MVPWTAVFIGLLTVTSYQSLPEQTDSTPFITSIGERVHPRGAAVSEDLLCPRAKWRPKSGKFRLCKREAGKCPKPHKLHYHDVLFVEGAGFRVVNDVMHPRHKLHIDLWVASYGEEKEIGWRKNIKVWRLYGK